MKPKTFRLFSRAAMLLMMLLTTASAWATDITVTYKIEVSGTIPQATITNAATVATVCTWNHGIKTLWPANETHVLNDQYQIKLTPDKELDKTDKNEYEKKASTTAFKTEQTTRFTVNVGNSQYYLKSVTFKEDNTVKASLEVAPNNKSGNVIVIGEKFFNYITVELTTDTYFRLTPSGALSISTTPARTYNNANYFVAGTDITIEPTNASCIVESVSGVNNATIAADKRSFSFAMPAEDISPSASLAEVHTISGVPNDVSISIPYTTIGSTKYYLKNQTYTLTAPTDKAFGSFTATGAASSSVAGNKKSATVTLASSDVTVTATLLTLSGTCGDGLTWSLAQDGNGNYTQLTIGGTGAMVTYGHTTDGTTTTWRTDAPWGWQLTSVTIGNGVTSIGNFAFIGCQSLATVTIGTGVTTIGDNAFDHCDAMTSVTLPASVTTLGANAFKNCGGLQRIDIGHDGAVSLAGNVFQNDNALQYIVFPSPTGALANTTGNWSGFTTKLRAKFGNQLFDVTNEGGTAAYKIATADDLRNLAAVINANNDEFGENKTFRQTAPIDLSSGGNFTPIGNTYVFKGTYDGGGKAISGLTVNSSERYAGLFGMVNGGTVKNVILVSPSVTSTYSDEYNLSILVGTIAGYCTSATIENCHAINPNVSADDTGNGKKQLGALIGELVGSATNCYYYSGNQSNAIGYGVGLEGVTVTRVSAAYLVTPGDGVTIQTAMAANLGFSYDSDGDKVAENYWREGAELTLSTSGNPGQGYQYAYTATAGTISGTTLTVGNADATVSAVLAPIDWAKESTGEDADHAYMIYNKDQLLLLAYRVNGTHGKTANTYEGKYFKLGANIKFDYDPNEGDDDYAENYETIGGWFDGWRYFKGDFDGDNKTISGIRIRKTGTDDTDNNQGLFGQLEYGANVHDVHLTDARIKGCTYVGGIVGYLYQSTVSNCTVTESAITAYRYYGIISGTDGGTLSHNYYRHCTVNGTAVISGNGCYRADITANDGAMPMYVAYIDADGKEQRCIDYKQFPAEYNSELSHWELTATTLNAGEWYVVDTNINLWGIDDVLTVNGNGAANIILCDGKRLDYETYDGNIQGSLNIYGQSKGTGVFKYINGGSYFGKNSLIDGNLTIYGGSVTIEGSDGAENEYACQCAINGSVTIYRGSLYAKGGDHPLFSGKDAIHGNVYFHGGSLTAIGGSKGSDDYAHDGWGIYGYVTLSWTSPDDRFMASSFGNVVDIASGKAFADEDGNIYSGTLNYTQVGALAEKTLTPAIALADNADNSSAIATAATACTGDKTLAVQLSGRTLWKDGAWNTLCLPFDLVLEESVLDGDNVTAMVLRTSDSGLSGTTLTLNFDDATTIPAGTPFIIRWGTPEDNPGTTLTDPVFSGVTVSTANNDVNFTGGSFKGTYAPKSWDGEDRSVLFLGEDNQLHWPLAGANINACRAYFQLADGQQAHEFVLNFGDGSEELSGVKEVKEVKEVKDNTWYDLSGSKLDGKPTKKGLYIHNGRKVVVK